MYTKMSRFSHLAFVFLVACQLSLREAPACLRGDISFPQVAGTDGGSGLPTAAANRLLGLASRVDMGLDAQVVENL